MKTIKIIKSVLAYLFTFFTGAFIRKIITNGADFFSILGCVACVFVVILASPLIDSLIKSVDKGR